MHETHSLGCDHLAIAVVEVQRMMVGATKQIATCEGRKKQGRSEKLKREQERLKRGSEENLRELEREPVKSLREKLKKK